MRVDGRLVRENELFVGAMSDGHDVHVFEFRAAFAPVAVGEDVVTSDLPACLELPAGRDCPVKESVEARDALASCYRFDMFEERREAADHTAAIEVFGHFEEFLE